MAPVTDVATIAELWRYPVKSMQGERLDAAEVGPLGLAGDRAFALRDLGTGLTLTARRSPDLLFASARLDGDDVDVTLPDGTRTTRDDDLSDWLGRRVELVRAHPAVAGRYEIATDPEAEDASEWVRWDGPRGSFHDSSRTQVSVIGRASLGGWDRRRFRANVIVEGPAPDAEADFVGRTLAAGGAELDVVKRIDRCVIVARPQPGGIDRDMDVLRTVARERGNLLGVGAMVRTPGRVAVGDAVRIGAAA
ncbi:MAG: MOSC N-terminal beta barrel domain-containing protein [Thermoleophilia bacterium]|nr:MOSC N-terminal beta barrel domain-containing protein [Thermoleophilia bacterium]